MVDARVTVAGSSRRVARYRTTDLYLNPKRSRSRVRFRVAAAAEGFNCELDITVPPVGSLQPDSEKEWVLTSTISNERISFDSSIERAKRFNFYPYDLPSDVR